jgi:hypothetical protein
MRMDKSACMAAIVQAIGQRLRHQYGALAQPMPERLTVLLRQLAQRDEPDSADGPDLEGLRSTVAR